MLAFDVEAYEHDHSIILEIGCARTTLDNQEEVKTFQYIIKENLRYETRDAEQLYILCFEVFDQNDKKTSLTRFAGSEANKIYHLVTLHQFLADPGRDGTRIR